MNIEVLSSTTIKTFPEGSADLQVANSDTEIKMSDDYEHTDKYVSFRLTNEDSIAGEGTIKKAFFILKDDGNTSGIVLTD